MLRAIPDDKVLRRNSRRLFSNMLFLDNVRLILIAGSVVNC